MDRFARLCEVLADTRDGAEQSRRLVAYFRDADPADAAAAARLLRGERPARSAGAGLLRVAALRACALPRWLFDASHRAVGNLAETIALVLPAPQRSANEGLDRWLRERVLPLATQTPDEIAARLADDWEELDVAARILHTKLVAGTFRSPVPAALVEHALAAARGTTHAALPAVPGAAAPPEITRNGRVLAVLIYAERATPKAYDLRKYTFAVWDERDGVRRLTPIAKLDIDAGDERAAIEAIVRRTTSERFGPVHAVTPTLVCEIAFAAVDPSPRHKAGIALRAPRFLRRLPGHAIDDAATLASLRPLADPRATTR